MPFIATPLLLCSLLFAATDAEIIADPKVEKSIEEALASAPGHPRLLITARDLETLRKEIPADRNRNRILEVVVAEADKMLEKAPSERIKQGVRLLSVSREVLRRVLFLSTAYLFTEDLKYAERAVLELRAAASFSDWNPSHFLDVAEMTTAFALGYDWLFAQLSEEDKGLLQEAIVTKGLNPSFQGRAHWARRDNNWNQVCNGGMLFGALALAEHEPALAKKVIARALDGLPYAMATYQPDGLYVEGPSYWEYGTTYNVLAIAALESSLGTDFGLADFPGFKETGTFPLFMTGPTGDHFTFSDCGPKGQAFPAVYWFARRWQDSGIASLEHRWLQKLLDGSTDYGGRFLPLMLFWWQGDTPAQPKQSLAWHGDGLNPIAVLRSSWESPDAVFIAIKGGTPRANHGHMDVGSFILEADGIRWAVDVMGKGYGELEALGLSLWSMKQESDRWKIFDYSNLSHNTLVVNGTGQIVGGDAPLVQFSDDGAFPFAVFDMTAVYQDQLAKAVRAAALLPDGRVVIQDELVNKKEPSSVRWAISTPAVLEATGDTEGILHCRDRQLRMAVTAPLSEKLQTLPEHAWQEWDKPRGHLRQVGFFMNLAPEEEVLCRVVFTPGSAADSADGILPVMPVSRWGERAEQE